MPNDARPARAIAAAPHGWTDRAGRPIPADAAAAADALLDRLVPASFPMDYGVPGGMLSVAVDGVLVHVLPAPPPAHRPLVGYDGRRIGSGVYGPARRTR